MMMLLSLWLAVASATAFDIPKHNARVDRYLKANPKAAFNALLDRDLEKVQAEVDDVLFGTLEKKDESISMVASPIPTEKDSYGISPETAKHWKEWGGDCTCVEKLFSPCGSNSDCPTSCNFNLGNPTIPVPSEFLSATYQKFGGVPSDSFHTNNAKQADPIPENQVLEDVWTGMLCAKPNKDDTEGTLFDKTYPECAGTGGCCLGKFPEGPDVCYSCNCPSSYQEAAAKKAESYDGVKKEELMGEDFYHAVRKGMGKESEEPTWLASSPGPGWKKDDTPGSLIGYYPVDKNP